LKRQIFWALSIALLVAPASFAQTATADGGPDPATVRVRLGPLWLSPTLSMPNLGIDTNVFNDPLNVTPKRDFTFDVLPKTELWLRMGRTWLFGTIAEEIVWYQTYTTERSVNGTYTIGWKAPLNRLLLTTSATQLSTRSRPGFEIDVRAHRREPPGVPRDARDHAPPVRGTERDHSRRRIPDRAFLFDLPFDDAWRGLLKRSF